MIISMARMITDPGTHDRSPPALSRTFINASSLVIPCSFLSLPGGAPPFPVPLLSYIMSSPSSPSDMTPITPANRHDTTLVRDL